jgi:hypothetical protein
MPKTWTRHDQRHPHAGKLVTFDSREWYLIDWLDRVIGGDWQRMNGIAKLATVYNRRRGKMGRGAPPRDSEVVALQHPQAGWTAAHVSELEFHDDQEEAAE